MTDKQKQRLKDKIDIIKKTLAAEKRKYGDYHDGRGLRYIPTELYIKIGDFKGGLRYIKWFNKTFDDIGFPEFLFESTVILFKTGNLKDAEKTALRTYFRNTFLFDIYFNKELTDLHKKVGANYEQSDWLQNFPYRHDNDDLLEFSDWLSNFIKSDKFLKVKNEYDDLTKRLWSTPIGPKRTRLIERLSELELSDD
jgi:hypothetical protein